MNTNVLTDEQYLRVLATEAYKNVQSGTWDEIQFSQWVLVNRAQAFRNGVDFEREEQRPWFTEDTKFAVYHDTED